MKETIAILRNLVYYNFLVDENCKNSNLDINSTILNTAIWLRAVFNIGADKKIEFFINDQIYDENDTLLLDSLGFDPETNIIEVEKSMRISNDSKILGCTLDNKNQKFNEIIRFNLFSINKILFVFKTIVGNFKTLKIALMETLYYRIDKADNPYEQEIVQKILVEIEELSDTYLAKLLSKLKKII